ncbi:hypothetical protein J6590_057655 [Homalodisca vitripennis]|nr:hypothetical protein J6590_057655 [Homalodisca vitripennis]
MEAISPLTGCNGRSLCLTKQLQEGYLTLFILSRLSPRDVGNQNLQSECRYSTSMNGQGHTFGSSHSIISRVFSWQTPCLNNWEVGSFLRIFAKRGQKPVIA